MIINIRPAILKDMAGIYDLVHELAIFEKAPEAHTATITDYERDFEAGNFEAHIAELPNGTIVGMIFYYIAYSTWRGRMLYLEDFVVAEAHRSSGLGQLLFDTFIAVATEKGCRLVKWQVLDWNVGAIRFYERQNATIETEWYNGKIIF